MAHWIEATAEHKKHTLRLNSDAIAFFVQTEKDGPTHIHFVGSHFSAGNPDLLVLEAPDELMARIVRPR